MCMFNINEATNVLSVYTRNRIMCLNGVRASMTICQKFEFELYNHIVVSAISTIFCIQPFPFNIFAGHSVMYTLCLHCINYSNCLIYNLMNILMLYTHNYYCGHIVVKLT